MVPEDGHIVLPLRVLEAGLSRRDVCRGVLVGFASLGLPACTSGGADGGPEEAGSGPEGGELEAPDAAQDSGQAGDGPAPPADASGLEDHAPAAAPCGATAVSTGKDPADFALGTATYFSAKQTFVCRDAGGLFALTAVCTHQACTVSFVKSTMNFNCPCHGSSFTFVGAVRRGPAVSPLRHYLVCIDGNGQVAFDPRMVVDPGTRLQA